jgi:hypothetical protein
MRLLLDTRAVLWWLMDDPHLSPGARTAIADPANQLLVRAAIGYDSPTSNGWVGCPPRQKTFLAGS